MPEPSDRDALAIVAAGAQDGREDAVRVALHTLYDRHATAVLHLAQSICRDPSLAEDVLHDVFVALARRAATFRGDSARGWLLAIAGNRARDLRRRSARRRVRERAAASGEVLEPAADWIIRDDLSARLAPLPDPLRLAVELRLRDGLSFAEVATALGVSLRTAKYRVADALERLRRREGEP